MSLVDRPAIVVEPVRRLEVSAAAQRGDLEPGVADQRGGALQAVFLNRLAPERDLVHLRLDQALDQVGQLPVLRGDLIEGEPAHPTATLKKLFARAAARSGSPIRPAASASSISLA